MILPTWDSVSEVLLLAFTDTVSLTIDLGT
jgi:hypothetical protein